MAYIPEVGSRFLAICQSKNLKLNKHTPCFFGVVTAIKNGSISFYCIGYRDKSDNLAVHDGDTVSGIGVRICDGEFVLEPVFESDALHCFSCDEIRFTLSSANSCEVVRACQYYYPHQSKLDQE